MKGKIAEIFESVQGEGIYFGERQLFVRFFGCNLNCRYCDTKLDCFREYDPYELVAELKLHRNHYHAVSFTGGEPLLQKDFLKEVARLSVQEKFKTYLETNGTLPEYLEEVIDHINIVSMDVKLPTSTGLDSFWGIHREFLKIASKKEVFVKAVICNSTEDEDLVETIRLIKEVNKAAVLVLQPNSFEDGKPMRQKVRRFKERCMRHHVTACVIPQMHKSIWMR